MWYEMQTTDKVNLELSEADKSEKGFQKLLTAVYFVWAYPRSAAVLASATGQTQRKVESFNLWDWVERISKLQNIKFVWPTEAYANPDRVFLVTVDGVDFKVFEKQHATMP